MSAGQETVSVLTLRKEPEDRSGCLFRLKKGLIRYDVRSVSSA